MGLHPVYQHPSRTIHRFYRIFFFINKGGVHVFAIIFPMTAFFPEAAIEHDRGFCFHITCYSVFFPPVIEKTVPDTDSLWMKKRHSRRFIVKTEKIKSSADLAVVSFFGFFNKIYVFIKLFRITSYNVCYTKLLRDKVKELLPEGGNLNLCLTCGARNNFV